MDLVTLGLGFTVGWILGGTVCWVKDVRPLIKTVIEMKKMGFDNLSLPEKPRARLKPPTVRED